MNFFSFPTDCCPSWLWTHSTLFSQVYYPPPPPPSQMDHFQLVEPLGKLIPLVQQIEKKKKIHFQLCTSKSINNFQHLSFIGMQIWEYRYTSTLEGNFHYKRLKTAAESDRDAHSLLPQCLCCRPSAASGRGLTFWGSTNVPVHRPSHGLLPPCEAAVALCNSKSLYSLCVHSMVCV